jgi:hypothetical protein
MKIHVVKKGDKSIWLPRLACPWLVDEMPTGK